jgi:hypothetical protein
VTTDSHTRVRSLPARFVAAERILNRAVYDSNNQLTNGESNLRIATEVCVKAWGTKRDMAPSRAPPAGLPADAPAAAAVCPFSFLTLYEKTVQRKAIMRGLKNKAHNDRMRTASAPERATSEGLLGQSNSFVGVPKTEPQRIASRGVPEAERKDR